MTDQQQQLVVCVSDLHGTLPRIEPCDLLIVGGDVCPVVDHSNSRQVRWMDREFRHWLEGVPAKRIIGTWGNHDFAAMDGEAPDDLPGTWLVDEATTWEGLTVWGSPWTPTFGSWAFMESDDKLAERWATIPDDTTILVTHGPPFGRCDQTARGPRAGSESLERRVSELPRLRLHVCGHIHEAYGVTGNTVNASLMTILYEPTNAPITRTIHA